MRSSTKLKGCRTVLQVNPVLANRLFNNIIDSWVMETGAVSSKTQEVGIQQDMFIYSFDNDGYMWTPRFSTMALEDIEYDQLRFMYPEFQGLEGNCRFNGCSHLREPGCAVKDSLKSGGISSSRYEGYQILYEELKLQYDNRYK